MRCADNWDDYELIDCSDGERLERWKDIILVRPDPQIVWKTPKTDSRWFNPHAVYSRSSTGGGSWHINKNMPPVWQVSLGELKFNIKTMGFKHTGLFPEQAVNWRLISEVIRDAGHDVKVLNLFAYTGGATIAALNSGASVTHVDASKGMTQWARENAVSSCVDDRPVRWLVDDCMKFVNREIRRGNKYDIIIMDPPSYGRGPSGEVWTLEKEIYSFASVCSLLLSDNPLLFMINSYTTGLSPSVMKYIIGETVQSKFKGFLFSDEIGLPVSSKPGRVLPCGATSIWSSNDIGSIL
ncbi:MAG: class I SAM-dependent methyltransferase [Clostridiales bacterium]|nr:class I SAM-dependent methyltransferase [Clostridiales bacterium]